MLLPFGRSSNNQEIICCILMEEMSILLGWSMISWLHYTFMRDLHRSQANWDGQRLDWTLVNLKHLGILNIYQFLSLFYLGL